MTIVERTEAILFVADSPVTINQLARALQATEGQVEAALEILQQRLFERSSLHVVQLAGGYQLATRPEFAELIGGFLQPHRQKLSRALIEVLAVVAYRQPVTAADIEIVRGVQSDYAIRALVERRLVRELGRKATPGRPTLYGTSKQFLHQFRLNDLSELPKIDDGPLVSVAKSSDPSLFEESSGR